MPPQLQAYGPWANQPFSKAHGTPNGSDEHIDSCEDALGRGTPVPAPWFPASLVWWQEEGQLFLRHPAQGGPRTKGDSKGMLTANLLPLHPAPGSPHRASHAAAPHPSASPLGSPRGIVTLKRT